jgi:curved DNA-binding protein CbpA
MYPNRLPDGNIPQAMNVDPRRSLYKVLMLDPSVDAEILSVVYRRLAHRFHPDVDPSPEAARRMLELNAAYEVLGDPAKRARYDGELAARRDRRATDRLIRRQGDVPYGAAGMPVGPPTGSVIDFGRYSGWTLGQIRRSDPDFLEWLYKVPAGRQYRDEIQVLLSQS